MPETIIAGRAERKRVDALAHPCAWPVARHAALESGRAGKGVGGGVVVHNHRFGLQAALARHQHAGAGVLEHRHQIWQHYRRAQQVLDRAEEARPLPLPAVEAALVVVAVAVPEGYAASAQAARGRRQVGGGEPRRTGRQRLARRVGGLRCAECVGDKRAQVGGAGHETDLRPAASATGPSAHRVGQSIEPLGALRHRQGFGVEIDADAAAGHAHRVHSDLRGGPPARPGQHPLRKAAADVGVLNVLG